MVAKITFPKFVKSALNYNEQKVKKGVAECIGADNILEELYKMNFYAKLAVFENRNLLNDRANTKTIHISLNFSPDEKLNNNQLTVIAESYMGKIGFGEQPYFVYRHTDAGHPHLHIVSTTIRDDGSRINTHNIGRNQSEKARKEIELGFGLVRAELYKREQEIKPLEAVAVIYGRMETKRGITNIVNNVINRYNYISLAQFNAVLKQYNVVADSGEKDGRIYKHRGLVYRVLDEHGNKAGVPIKASSINSKPTLTCLEQKFEVNKDKRERLKLSLKRTLDESLHQSPASLQDLIESLVKNQVITVFRQNDEGRIYGITFIDNRNKCVFNGSDLGKSYSIAALQNSFFKTLPTEKITEENVSAKNPDYSSAIVKPSPLQTQVAADKEIKTEGFLQQLLLPEKNNENIPGALLKKKRKRKKNRNV